MTKSLRSLVVLCGAMSLWLASASASAQSRPSFPQLGAEASPSSVTFRDVTTRAGHLEFVAIRNRTACPIEYDVKSAPGSSSSISVLCRSSGPGGSIHEGGSASCEVRFVPYDEEQHRRVVEVTYGYSQHCLFQEIQAHDGKLAKDVRDKDAELYSLKAAGPDYAKVDQAEEDEKERYRMRDKALREALEELQAGSPEVEKLQERQREKRAEFARAIEKQSNVLYRYKERGADYGVIEEKEAKIKRDAEKENQELRRKTRTTCDDYRALEQEKKQAIAELKQGYFCSECGRSASQIERETGKAFRTHVREVRGRAVPASREVIDKTVRHYDELISRGRDKCETHKRQLPHKLEEARQKWEKRWDQVQAQRQAIEDRYNKRVENLEEQINRLRMQAARSEEQYTKQLREAEERHFKKIEQTEQAIKDNHKQHDKMLDRFHELRVKIHKAHEAEVAQMAREVEALRQKRKDFERWVAQQRKHKRHFTFTIEGNRVSKEKNRADKE